MVSISSSKLFRAAAAALAVLAVVAVAALQPLGVSAEPGVGSDGDSNRSGGRLAISDLSYEGAFRIREADNGVSSLSYSNAVIALGDGGDSFFIEGHVHNMAIAEYPMVEPTKASNVADLPMTGAPLQPFTDMAGRVPNGNPQALDRYRGMMMVDGSLIVNGFEYYDAPADNSHTTLAVADASNLGGSAVTGWASMAGANRAGGWLSPIPTEWQGALGGTHISGSSSGFPIIGRASVGPSAFVLDLDPSLGSIGQAEEVLGFSLDRPLAADLANDSGDNDLWTHLSRAVYGVIVPGTDTYLTIGRSAGHETGVAYGISPHGDGGKGYHPRGRDDISPYYWLWDVNDLVAVRGGEMAPHEVRPYDHGPVDLPFAEFAGDRWDDVGGAAYDPATGRLYVTLSRADRSQGQYTLAPLMLAFQIDAANTTGGTPTTTTPTNEPTPTSEHGPGEPSPGGGSGGSGEGGPEVASDFCPSYEQSIVHRDRERQITVGPDDDWEQLVAGASSGTEILLENGEYRLERYAVYLDKPGLTIRGASGNRDAVVIRGQGYGVGAEGLMVAAPDIVVADLTMTAIRDHAISMKPAEGAGNGASETIVYNVHLVDNGTQQIKGATGGDNTDGVVACSSIGYTPGGVQGDYIAAIDLHQSIDWVIRDNYIYNVSGDGSGCNIDTECGTYVSHPAILVWNNSSGAVIERNTIVDSWRGITLGLGRRYDGGVVRNNFIWQSEPGDAGIELQDAHGVVIEHNTVMVNGYRGAIEYGGSSDLVIRNNLVTAEPLDRPERGESTEVRLVGNITDATVDDLAGPLSARLRDGSRAIGAGVVTSLGHDIDGDARSGSWDVGADQSSSGGGSDGGSDSGGGDSGSGGGDDDPELPEWCDPDRLGHGGSES